MLNVLSSAEKAVLTEKLAEDRPSRLKRQPTSVFMPGLPDVLRKPRKKLTPEELAERKQKVILHYMYNCCL